MNKTHVALLCAAATIGGATMTGCGGSSSDPATTTAAPATKTNAAAAPAAKAEAETEAVASASTPNETTAANPGPDEQTQERTPMGSTLKLGQPAVVVYDDTSKHRSTTIEVTPKSIERGAISDFTNIKLDADQKTATPFYVKLAVSNVGHGNLSGTSPGTYINGIDDRGQTQNEVIFFGDFDRCPGGIPKSFKPGESYATCLTYLIPKGGSLTGMRWIAFDEKTGKSDITWR